MSEVWHYQGRIVAVESPWVRLFSERWIDHQGQHLEYWRVERAHSVIVLPLQGSMILLPRYQFRPGVQQATLDLPGGRLPEGKTPLEVAPLLLQKELGIEPSDIGEVKPLNSEGWIINSSFSNQLLYGIVASINEHAVIDPLVLGETVAVEPGALRDLLNRLACLQCRAVLQEFLLQQ